MKNQSRCEEFKAVMIMNSDSTATLRFIKVVKSKKDKITFKEIEQLSLNLKLGDMDEINRHVSYRYKLAKYDLMRSKQQLNDILSILKSKNPSLIS